MSLERDLTEAGCDWTGCSNLAQYQVCFRVWATLDGERLGKPVEVATGLVVCDAHRDPDSVQFSDGDWLRISAGFAMAGKREPDKATLEVFWRPLR